MRDVKVRNRWSKLRRTVDLATPPEAALTQQQFKAECDMNNIVMKAKRGIPPRFMAQGTPQYGDFSNVPDLAEFYAVVDRAEQAFAALPAELRRDLDNDPRNLPLITREMAEKHKLLKPQPEAPESEAEGAPLASPPKASPKPPAGSKTKPKASSEGSTGE